MFFHAVFDASMASGSSILRRQFANSPAGCLAHRMAQLDKELSRERSHLHAAERAGPHTRVVQRDIRAHLKQLQRRLATLQQQALMVIGQDEVLAEDARIIDSAPGFAELSATRLVAELSALHPDISAPQWVAQAGMDPRPSESGTSQRGPRRISKLGNARLRHALSCPLWWPCDMTSM